MDTLISTLVWAAIVNGLFLAGLYLFSIKYRSLANRLLGLFLLAIIYEGMLAFLPYESIGEYSLYYFALPEVKLFYPVLFFHYVLEKTGRTERYRTVLRIQYILAFVVAGITLLNVALYLIRGKKIEDYLGKPLAEHFFMGQQYLAFLLVIAVWILAILEVRRYRKVVQKNYSDQEMLNINWLWGLIFSILPIIIAWGTDLISIISGGQDQWGFELVTWGFVIVFLYFVSYQAFKHKNLFEGLKDQPEPDLPEKSTPEQVKKNGLLPVFSEEEDEDILRRIKQHMHDDEPYLDASLSIHQLAEQTEVPVRELSLLINHKLDKHFFDFVNEYRVKKAMALLRDPQQSKLTVLEILYEVGFNSKSSFNTVFKKVTGKTPTQYRKQSRR